jgi:hypothetical protein
MKLGVHAMIMYPGRGWEMAGVTVHTRSEGIRILEK